jgi:hypothetical protein
MVGANFKITQSVTQAQIVICLELVSEAGSADALEVFAAVWIPFPQLPD